METTTTFTADDMTALLFLVEAWGHAEWSDGWVTPDARAEVDDFEAGRRMAGRRVAVATARGAVSRRLAELVEDGKISEDVTEVVWEGLVAWAEHMFTVGEVSRNSTREGTHNIGRWQLDEEERSQALRQEWARPLAGLLNTSTTPTVV